jgi:hypothetical protein
MFRAPLLENKTSVKISISDNGIGCVAARENIIKRKVISTGLGINLMQDYIGFLNKNNNQKISLAIIDLKDEQNESGTSIKIKAPGKFDYKFPILSNCLFIVFLC